MQSKEFDQTRTAAVSHTNPTLAHTNHKHSEGTSLVKEQITGNQSGYNREPGWIKSRYNRESVLLNRGPVCS